MNLSKKTSILSLAFSFLLASGLWGQNGVIKGTITNSLNNEPVGFANVLVLGTDFGAVTDFDGNYEITGIEPGLYDVRASYIGFNDLTEYEIQVTNSKPAVVDFALEEFSTQLEEVVVKASPFKKTEESPVSLRTIGVAEIQRNPGGNRDISRVVQSLPGVTSTANFRNDLIIRGGAPNENRFYLDDVEVPNINHFATQGSSGGPVGLINVNFIKEVDFYSGAFPANRGNSLSSVFNFRQRDGRDDRFGATFMVGASDFGLTVEGPVGEKFTYLASVRRSYLQGLFQVLGLPFLPTYNDAQVKLKYKIDQKNEVYFIGLGALDQFSLNLEANETEEQQFLLNNLPVTPQWNYTNGLVYKHYRDRGYWTFVLSRNMLNNESIKYFENDDSDPDNLILDYQSQEAENKLRIENTTRFGDYKFTGGVGYEYVKYSVSNFSRVITPFGVETLNFSSSLDFSKYYGFAQISRKFFSERLILSLGARIDANNYSDDMSNPLEQFSPRASLAFAITDRFFFNANAGRYYQLPPYTVLGYREDGILVNRENNIRFIQADHLVAGFEWNTATSSKITVEGYYKWYEDYPFLLRDSITLANLGGDFGVIGNEPAISRSSGRTYGMEFLFQQRLYKGFYGIGSYTLGVSEFEDKNGNFVPTSWDARHIVNITLGKKFKKDWEVGINWRFQTGLPYTPPTEDAGLVQVWNVANRALPDFDQINTLRAPASNTLDIRVDKKWFFEKWSLNIYVDVENVTANTVAIPTVVLDRPLDENNTPIGSGVIANPEAPIDEQRYLLKELAPGVGVPIPSIGLMVEL